MKTTEFVLAEIYDKSKTIEGFTVKKGFARIISPTGETMFTSGWLDDHSDERALFIYKYEKEWKGDWYYGNDIERIIEAIEEYNTSEEFRNVAAEAAKLDEKELYITTHTLIFTDVIPGEKCYNGGEYRFYSEYYPTPVAGVYFYKTTTTSDFKCGTGPQGYVIMTKKCYQKLKEEENQVYKLGCKY